jgi:hypothetical protein
MADFQIADPRFKQLQQRFFVVGIAGFAVSILLGIFNTPSFFQGYLLSFFFWNGLALGCMSVLMLHHIVAGAWGFMVQRVVEAGSRNLWWMPVLFAPMFIPLFLQNDWVWPWASPEYLEAHHIVEEKTPYLNAGFFTVRFIVYFAIWLGLAYCLNAWSKQQDENGDAGLTVKLRNLSAIGLVIYVLSATFAITDWGMSIEPEWFSTIYPPIHIAGYGLCALVFSIMMLGFLSKNRPHADVISVEYFHHLGSLTLGITIVWSYFSFSQFLITWSGNLPEEIGFFLHRTGTPLIIWAVVLILVPFRDTPVGVAAKSCQTEPPRPDDHGGTHFRDAVCRPHVPRQTVVRRQPQRVSAGAGRYHAVFRHWRHLDEPVLRGTRDAAVASAERSTHGIRTGARFVGRFA